MKITKVQSRDRKLQHRRNGHRENGRSVKYLREIQKRKAELIRKEREVAEIKASITFDIYEVFIGDIDEQKRRNFTSSR